MDIIVCIKQVPDTKNIKLDPVTNTLKREGVESILNPFDMFAVEAALRLKDQFGGKVTAVTMGPPQAEQALRQVVEYGVDEVALLSDRAFAGADTWATAYTLAKGIEAIGKFDLIVCGQTGRRRGHGSSRARLGSPAEHTVRMFCEKKFGKSTRPTAGCASNA